MRPAVTIAVKRNLDHRQAAEIELWELPGGKLSVRLLEKHNSPLGEVTS